MATRVLTPAGGGDLDDGAVTTSKLANLAVTTAKLANTSVTTDKLASGSVTNAKIGGEISFAHLPFSVLTQSAYDALSSSEKSSGTVYLVYE